MEAKPLIDEDPGSPISSSSPRSSSPTVEIPDFVITFPRLAIAPEEEGGASKNVTCCASSTAGPKTFNAKDLRSMLVEIGVKLDDDGQTGMYPECQRLMEECEADAKKQVNLNEVQNVLVKDFAVYLSKHGCNTSAFMSCDRDQLFVLISLGDSTKTAQADEHKIAIKTALRHGAKLQSSYNRAKIYEKLQLKQDVKPGEEMYRLLVREDEDSYDLYKKYSAGIAGTHGSILRAVDRYRILKATLYGFMDLEEAMGAGFVDAYYIPHNFSKLEEFRSGKLGGEDWDTGHQAWSNLRPLTIIAGLYSDDAAQPILEIRNYFGERIGFYFLWLSYTARFVALMVPVSFYFAIRYNLAGNHAEHAAEHFFAALFFCVSSAFYLKFWTRLQSHYFELWDVSSMQMGNQQLRPQYRGTLTADHTDGDREVKEYPMYKQVGATIVSHAIAAIFICLVLYSVALVYELEVWIPRRFPSMTSEHSHYITSAMFTTQILVFQLVWNYVSDRLVDLSNPRTEEDANSLSIQFLFPLSMISAYANIIYHSFYKLWEEQCMTENCMYVMRPALYQVVVPALLLQVVSLFKPYVVYRYQLYAEDRAIHKPRGRSLFSALCGSEPDARPDAPDRRTFLERQAKRQRFDLEVFDREMNLMMILLGYALLFAFVAPGITLAVALAFLAKVRIDAFKLCSVYQRVAPNLQGVLGIGEWNTMLAAVCHIGRWTSFAIPVFNLAYFQGPNSDAAILFGELKLKTTDVTKGCVHLEESHGMTFFQKLALICVLKISTDLICSLIAYAIDDVSTATKILKRKREAVRLRHLSFAATQTKRMMSQVSRGFIKGGQSQRPWFEEVADDQLAKLDRDHPDWGKYDCKVFAPWASSTTYFGGDPIVAARAPAASADPEISYSGV